MDMKNKLNIQLFAEGGDGAASAAATGEAGSGVAEAGKAGKGNPLSDVIYGKQTEGNSITGSENGADSKASKSKSQSFEELIKGEYKDEFNKRTQSIIDKRFKETKGLQEQLKSMENIRNTLSQRYGVDANDIQALQKAMDEDDSYFEKLALDHGSTVEQEKEVFKLRSENEAFKRAEAEANQRANTERIVNDWQQQAEALKNKFGLENFSLETEIQNPAFLDLIKNPNISVETAYFAVHQDELIPSIMQKTATNVREKLANSVSSRQARPAENGTSTQSSQIFKTDVNSLTKADRDEIERRVMGGAIISF